MLTAAPMAVGKENAPADFCESAEGGPRRGYTSPGGAPIDRDLRKSLFASVARVLILPTCQIRVTGEEKPL